MTSLNTRCPTIVFKEFPLIDPGTIGQLTATKDERLNRSEYYYGDTTRNLVALFVRDVASHFLEAHGFPHRKDIWYMDCIQYNLHNDTKPVTSGLAWHCENDNYPDLITVLLYLRKDEGIKDGNLRYKDKYNKQYTIEITSGTTIIMDGMVQHKPQDPYGSGKRDLLIVSFRKI